jgi:hypothetical protein
MRCRGACREMRCAYKIFMEYLREQDYFEDVEKDGRIILKLILKKWCEGVDWIQLAQDRNEKWAHVDTLMNVWVENFLAC